MATDVSDRDAPAPQDHALVNGSHEDSIAHDAPNHTANTESFEENAALPSKEPPFDLKATATDPAGPTPTEDVSSGIQPVADFVPKDAPTLSHPTPPPEEPLITSQANLDTQMGDADAEVSTVENADAARAADNQASVVTENATATAAPNAESGLVRPREEDDDEADEERAVKRSKVDDEVARSQAMQPESALADPAAPLTNGDAGEHQATTDHSFQPLEPTAEAGQESTAEVEMTEPRPEAATEPVPEAAKTGSVFMPAPPLQNDAEPPGADAAVQEPQSAVAPAPVEPSAGSAVEQDAKPAADVKPSVEAKADPTSTAAAIPDAQYSTAPMTDFQKATLLEKMKNLKKTKHSAVFLKPVDPVALNIPTYPEIIKNPMDLGTMDAKLKANQYESVQAFVDDFNLIIQNCRKFNGDAHPITASAFNIEAYFKRTMETVPGPDAAPPARAPKRASPAVKNPARREPRAPAPAAQAPPAIGLDRRESIATGREPRTVKPTGPREIPYAKPKRKEHALELKFCEHILRQIESPTLAHYNVPFLTPVDPVALNIPHYRQVIKHPMDISTMWQKLRSGQYSKAHEFRKDFELMVENCLTFNPQGNPVRDMGIGLRREFERFWKEKEKWERQHKPDPVRGASASADEESDEDEEDEDPGEDDKARQIKMLQEQLAAMQNVIGGLVVPEKSTKKAKKPKGDKKSKAGGASAVSKARPAPAPAKKKAGGKPKQVTYEEKQEISEAVNRMDEGQVSELTRIITENCVKYRDMEEMELEIDELPNDVQALLLKYVRRLFGRPKSVATYQTPDSPPDAGAEEDDEEYVAERGRHGSMGGGSKRKKHKPMSKQQQTAKMAELQNKLAQFDNAGTSGSMSPSAAAYHQNNAAESSGDDESEESEEE